MKTSPQLLEQIQLLILNPLHALYTAIWEGDKNLSTGHPVGTTCDSRPHLDHTINEARRFYIIILATEAFTLGLCNSSNFICYLPQRLYSYSAYFSRSKLIVSPGKVNEWPTSLTW